MGIEIMIRNQVTIADDRTSWMKEEDRIMACLLRCPVYKYCSSRFGTDCKRLGGSEIPKLIGGKSNAHQTTRGKAGRSHNTPAHTARNSTSSSGIRKARI